MGPGRQRKTTPRDLSTAPKMTSRSGCKTGVIPISLVRPHMALQMTRPSLAGPGHLVKRLAMDSRAAASLRGVENMFRVPQAIPRLLRPRDPRLIRSVASSPKFSVEIPMRRTNRATNPCTRQTGIPHPPSRPPFPQPREAKMFTTVYGSPLRRPAAAIPSSTPFWS